MICRFANDDLNTFAILKIRWPQSVGPGKKNTCNTVLLGELLKSITAILFVLQFAQQANCYMYKIYVETDTSYSLMTKMFWKCSKRNIELQEL